MLEYWECLLCGDTPIFESQQAFTDHILQSHSETISPNQIPMLVSSLKYSVPVDIDSCPLCQYADTGQDEIDRDNLLDHIAEHIHDFSIRALPWPSNDKETGPSHLSRSRVSDWDLGNTTQDLMEKHNYVESLSVSTVEYDQWYQEWISKLRLQEDLHPGMQSDEVLRSNYFDNNQYFNETSNTQSSAEGSRDYQKLLATEKLPPFWNVPYSRNFDLDDPEEQIEVLVGGILNTKNSLRVVLRGSGKLEAAKEVAYRVSSESPEHSVCWMVPVRSKKSITYDFRRIGQQLQIDTPQFNDPQELTSNPSAIEEQVWQHLAGDSIGPWLMIFEDIGYEFMELRVDAATATTDEIRRKQRTKDVDSIKCTIPNRSRSCIIFITTDQDFPGFHDGSTTALDLSLSQNRNPEQSDAVTAGSRIDP